MKAICWTVSLPKMDVPVADHAKTRTKRTQKPKRRRHVVAMRLASIGRRASPNIASPKKRAPR